MTSTVIVERDAGIAIVTLNRPEQMNAVSHVLRAELIDRLRGLNADSDVRAVILTGAGPRAFCAGQDVREAAVIQTSDVPAWLNAQQAMYQAVQALDKPCVAALNGVAAGAGFQLALCADWRIAMPDIKIGQPEVKAGLASVVGSYLMTLHVGLTHNLQLSLSGDLISARRGYEIGLITELCDAQVLQAAISRARSLSDLPRNAVRLSKQRFRALTQPGFEQACAAGIEAQLECYANGEPQLAMQTFLNTRVIGGRKP